MEMKIYEANTLVHSVKERAEQYKTLKEQFQKLKTEFARIVDNENFLGNGAEAIKGFYQAQIDVANVWIQFIDQQVAFFEGIQGMTEDVQLSGDTVVKVPFLEENLPQSNQLAKEMVTQQQEDLQQIFNDIEDLISLQVFSKEEFDENINESEKERNETIQKVNELDEDLTTEYALSEQTETYVYALFNQLMEATRKGENISPLYFNANAYKTSEIYQLKDDVAKQTNQYLTFKKDQHEARELAKEIEAQENRPWYEKAWEATKTFTGEITGYYDTKRAVEGVDPVTGRKLSEAERITAGAMAAAGFIPVVGWAGRAFKGGKAIYSTAKGMDAASTALNAYKTSNSLSILQKSEMGIYGLVSANGLSEAMLGKDMFGNELTDEQRQNSLLTALGIVGVAGAAKYVDHLQVKNAPYQTTDLLKENKVVRKYAEQIAKHPNPKPVEDVLRYVIKKQNSIGTKVMLDDEVVEKVLKEVKPNITIRELENIKWNVIEEATSKNKAALKPSQRAKLWQGSHPYFGIDTYEDIILKKGTVLYAGYPRPTGYSFTKEVLDSVNGDSKRLFQGVQVNPREFDDGTGDYKFQIIAFELLDDLPSARGMTDANPQFGLGGLEQIFTPDFDDLLREGKVIPILEDVTKDKLREKGIEFEPKLLQQKDENGKYMYETISKTFVEISEDPHVIKLGNYKLTEEEVLQIKNAVKLMEESGKGIK
ncbi:ribonuclease YeeF family protein [Peribacillus asahii]|uniref:ribonuclease YeeF family protein n=1 Tax=Peribacillus asahii TaxID=228899 RepID=UPI00207AB6E9|nr:T7SS effector LXG polymorphic toxin [Peribacillus asahii]USK58759.1 pre-toxin TG domain-containing protein [Peribacillus asahii]